MRRAAAESEPSATTAAKLRQRAQSGSELAIPFNPVWLKFIHRQFRIGCEWTIFGSSTAKEHTMSTGRVTVLGVNGHIGQAVAKAFVAQGWEVPGMARADKRHTAGVRFVQGDSDSVEDMRRAIGDAEVVVNALNLPYDKWFYGAMEALMARVAEAMGTSGKTMLFPGNVYNYAADCDVLTP